MSKKLNFEKFKKQFYIQLAAVNLVILVLAVFLGEIGILQLCLFGSVVVAGFFYKKLENLVTNDVLETANERTPINLEFLQNPNVPETSISKSMLVVPGKYKTNLKVLFTDAFKNKVSIYDLSVRVKNKPKYSTYCSHGSFVVIDLKGLPKLDCDLVVREKPTSDRLEKPDTPAGWKLIKGLNGTFDKHFEVFAKNKMRAARFLSPTMLEKFVKSSQDHTIHGSEFLNNLLKTMPNSGSGNLIEFSILGNKAFIFMNGRGMISFIDALFGDDIETVEEKAVESILEVIDFFEEAFDYERFKRLG